MTVKIECDICGKAGNFKNINIKNKGACICEENNNERNQ